MIYISIHIKAQPNVAGWKRLSVKTIHRVQQELWCSIKNVCTCECEMERRGERRGWTKTSKVAGGRNNLQLNAQTQNSIIKASNMRSKDNFNCAGAQNDWTVYTNSTWRTRKPLRTSVTPGGKLWRRRREHWEVELFWLTHASTPATAAESTQWQIVKHIITG